MLWNRNIKELLIIFIILIIGIFLRIYNLNFEDFWIDEMVSFWAADPRYNISDTILRLTQADLHILFNIVLKYYFAVFSYKIELARYVPLIFSILSLFLILYLASILQIRNIILILFLFSFNIYLIKFSQELRSYSFIFFLTILTLIFFFKIIDENNKNKKLLTIFFILSQIFLILTHVFTFIIFFSFLIFNLIFFLKNKKIYKYLFISNVIVGLFISFFLIIYLKYFKLGVDWLPQIQPKFYTNFFFSKFFGSRILGLVHLILLIYLIIKSKIFLPKHYNLKIIFILIIIFSYILPLIYGYSIKPILQDKYIIFVIIPIIIVLVDFLTFIENNFIKKTIIFFLFIFTIANFFTETTFKQFIVERKIHKPDLKSVFYEINKSNVKNYSFNLEKSNWTSDQILNEILKNYSEKYIKKKDYKLNFYYYNNNEKVINYIDDLSFLWLICLNDLNGRECSIPIKFSEANIIEDKNFNNINLKLLKF